MACIANRRASRRLGRGELMRIEELERILTRLREAKQHEVFNSPPQSMEDFKERKGGWLVLGEVLGIIEDAKKKEGDDD